MGSNLDVSVGVQSGSDKATTASDSKVSDNVTNSSESPNLDKPVLPARASTPFSDSESNQNSTPDNTCSAILVPREEEVNEREYKGEQVIRAALELAAIARGKAEKALSMRAEERNGAEITCITLDGLAHSMPQPRVSPSTSPVHSPRLLHRQAQSAAHTFGGQQSPAVRMTSQQAPVDQPTVPQRHPSPTPRTQEAARPYAQTLSSSPHSTLAGSPGLTRSATSVTNLTQPRSPITPGSRSPGPVHKTRTPASTSSATQQHQQKFPQGVATQLSGQQPMTRRR